MNKKYYSSSTCGFYVSAVYGNNIPSDAKEITDEQYTELLNGQSNGKIISSDKNGFPILISPNTQDLVKVTRITRAQGKKQLISSGIYEKVKAWVDDPAVSEIGRIGFYDEQYWLIDDEFVLLAKNELKLTDAQLQDLFNQAAKI